VLDEAPRELHGAPPRDVPLLGGTLYVVATPIGNLEDLTLRAIRTLRQADVIASEDTRVTAALLRHLGIRRKRIVSHHEHNAARSVPLLLAALAANQSVALVSDAGTPGISDPGLEIAAQCIAHGHPLVPVPGACAATAALSVSALDAREFTFFGFVPRAGRSRREKVRQIANERRACVLYEAPHRVVSTLTAIAEAGAAHRQCVCSRELTKVHEEHFRGDVSEAAERFAAVTAQEGRVRGEFTIVLAPLDRETTHAMDEEAKEEKASRVSELLKEELALGTSVSRAAKLVATSLSVPKAKVYAEALRLSGTKTDE